MRSGAGKTRPIATRALEALAALSAFVDPDAPGEPPCSGAAMRNLLRLETAGLESAPACAAHALMGLAAILFNNRAAARLAQKLHVRALEDATVAVFLCSDIMVEYAKTAPSMGRDVTPFRTFLRMGSTEAGSIMLKAQRRRALALLELGNTGRYTEEFALMRITVTLVESQAQQSGRPPSGPTALSMEQAREMAAAMRLRHPDAGRAASHKMDWSLAVPGRWRKLITSGATPPRMMNRAGAAVWKGKVYLAAGVEPGMLGPGPAIMDVRCLDLATNRWTKVKPGAGSYAVKELDVGLVAAAQWRERLYLFNGERRLLYFDCKREVWVRPKAKWGRRKPAWEVPGERLIGTAMAALDGKIYLFGGAVSQGFTTEHKLYNTLAVYDPGADAWELLFEEEQAGPCHPYGSYEHAMWAAAGKVYVYGGRISKALPTDDWTIGCPRHLWSWDVAARRWANEGAYVSGGACTNVPCARSELSVSVAPGAGGSPYVAVYGGYTTTVSVADADSTETGAPKAVHTFAYLSDTFVYDVASRTWRMVCVGDSWPVPRAGAPLVWVPDADAPAADSGDASASASGGGGGGGAKQATPAEVAAAAAWPRKGRWLLVGGFNSAHPGLDPSVLPPVESQPGLVWELRLASTPRRVKTVCHGCGKFTEGCFLCGGTCGGAVAVCGDKPECFKKVWATHKDVCRRA